MSLVPGTVVGPYRIAALIGAGSTMPYDVATDGRFLLNRATDDTGSHPLTLVTNWPASIAK